MATKKPAPAAPKTPAVIRREASANNYIAMVGAAALAVVLICGFIGKGLAVAAVNNSKLILRQNQARADLDKKLQDIPVLIDNYNALGSKKDLIIHALPVTPGFPEIVSAAQSMGANAGVQLKSVSPLASDTPAVSGSEAAEYKFSVEIGGSYPQVVQFFRNVELSARPMRVISTDLAGADGSLRVTAVISTYYQDKARVEDETGVIK